MSVSDLTVDGILCKEIPGADGYVAGEDGKIRSCWTERHPVKTSQWRFLAERKDKKGYLRVTFGHRSKRQNTCVHRLVLLAFRGPCPDGCEACHGDRDRTNNKPDNLRWDTHQANIQDSIRHGTFNRCGIPKRKLKLSILDVECIRTSSANGVTNRELARRYNVTPTYIRLIVQCKSWVQSVAATKGD